MAMSNISSLIPGETWLSGVGVPNPNFGYKTQFYLNEANGDVYQKTEALVWTLVGSIASGGGGGVTSVNGETGDVILDAADVGAIPTGDKGVANGVASLDATGKVPSSQLPPSSAPVTSVNGETGAVVLDAADVGALPNSGGNLTGDLRLLNQHNLAFFDSANNNYVGIRGPAAPAYSSQYVLPSVQGTNGQILSTDNSGNLNWINVPSASVVSVNGKTGSVVLTTGDIAESGTNYYFTDARARTAAVVNSTAGNQTDQAPSVSSIKSYISSLPTGITSVNGQTGPSVTVGALYHPNSPYNDSTYEYGVASSSTGRFNTAIGAIAMNSIRSGEDNTAFGYAALNQITVSVRNTAIGSLAGLSISSTLSTAGNSNTLIGYKAGWKIETGNSNVLVGANAGFSLGFNSSYNTFINAGDAIGAPEIRNGIVNIGKDSSGGTTLPTGDNQFILGTSNHKYRLPGVFQSSLVLGPTGISSGETGIIQLRELASNGTNYVALRAPNSISGNYTFTLPNSYGASGQFLTSDGLGGLSWTSAGGATTGTLVHPTEASTYEAGSFILVTGVSNTMIGYQAGFIMTGSHNVGIGDNALFNSSSPGSGSFWGCVGIGSWVMSQVTSDINNTVAIGAFAGGVEPGSNSTHINSDTGTGYNGVVSIGRDASGTSPSGAMMDNLFTLGTSNHKYRMPGKIYGDLTLGNDPSMMLGNGRLVFNTGSGDIILQAPSMGATATTYTLPTTDGSPGQSLKTDGAGNLYWG